jgi:glyoxylase-like metal-dependent hydrolase (beta-lactamase superfamily II)
LSAAVAAAAFGLDKALTTAAPARGQKTPDPAKGFFRSKVGYAGCTDVKWWTDPSLVTRLPEKRWPLARRIKAVIPNWKNVLPVEVEDGVVRGIRLVSTPGHTPGHTAFHISSGNEQLMISSDGAYLPALCAI